MFGNFNVPFFSDPIEETWQQLEVGDFARVKRRAQPRPGEVAGLTEIDAQGGYHLKFPDDVVVVYDGDDLRLARKKEQ